MHTLLINIKKHTVMWLEDYKYYILYLREYYRDICENCMETLSARTLEHYLGFSHYIFCLQRSQISIIKRALFMFSYTHNVFIKLLKPWKNHRKIFFLHFIYTDERKLKTYYAGWAGTDFDFVCKDGRDHPFKCPNIFGI